MLVLSALLLVGALAVSAQDDEAPQVAGPADRPGADVVWEENVKYQLDARGSTDNVGIVSYWWNITDPDMTTYTYYPTAPQASPMYNWTPTSPGIYKIVTEARDAAGNIGYHLFMIDVYEVIPAQTIRDTSVSYDHSVAVTSGEVDYLNADIDISGGYDVEAAPTTGAPDTLAEGLTNSGTLAGHWEPYYYLSYWASGNDWYGKPSEDTSTVLSGSKSIQVSGGYYLRGFEYHFDSPVDLTGYEALSWWMHSNIPSYREHNCMYYVYFYPDYSYSWSTGYSYVFVYYQGGYSWYGGWHGYTVSLDRTKTGRWYDRNMPDLSNVAIMRFYTYTERNYYSYGYSQWIDNVGFYNPTWGDEITESATPSGDKAGYWSSSYGVTTDYSEAFTGSASVRVRLREYSYNSIYYRFNSPQDLSKENALRFFCYAKDSSFNDERYLRYWRNSQMYVYDQNGNSAYYRAFYRSSWWWSYYTYIYYGYGQRYGGPWYAQNLPWGSASAYRDYGVDWTKISYFRFANMRPEYTSTYCYLYIDALEWYEPAGAASTGPPVNTEDIPHGIYALGTSTLDMDKVTFTSSNPYGAFIKAESTLEIKGSTFSGLWGTTHPTIPNQGQTYGGIMAMGADVDLDDIIITSAPSSAIYLENCDGTVKNLDISGTGTGFGGAAGLMVAYVNTDVGTANAINVSASELTSSSTGAGLMVMSANARGDADVDLHDIAVTKNSADGAQVYMTGWTGNLTVTTTESEYKQNVAAGLSVVADKTMATTSTKVLVEVLRSELVENDQYGFLFTASKANLNLEGTFKKVEAYDNLGSGIGFYVDSHTGKATFNMENVKAHENTANGVFVRVGQTNFRNAQGNKVIADGEFMLDMDTCTFESNEGDGVREEHHPYGSYNDHPEENYKVVARDLTIEKNEGHGYHVRPESEGYYANIYSDHEFYDCLFSDNKGAGVYLRHKYRAYTYYGLEAQETFLFEDCTFTYNQRGLEDYFDRYSYCSESWTTLRGCTFQDNDHEAIRAHSQWYSSYGGYSRSYWKTWEYDIQDSLLDGMVYMRMSGAYDYGRYIPVGKITVINNTYTQDEPMYLHLGAMYYSDSRPFQATIVYKDNKHTSPSTDHGINVELKGGGLLTGNVVIENQKIIDPLGHGVRILFGTSYTSTRSHGTTGSVQITNVEVRNPLEDGFHLETWHYQPDGASDSAFFSLLDCKATNSKAAVKSLGFDGEIRRCTFKNTRQETIFTYFGVIDVYETPVGEIVDQNLRVEEKGAIRLWFDLTIRVVWRDDPDTAVKGASVELMDNSWTILGVNSIEDLDGIRFSNLNSYTVLPEGIYTKNPFMVTVDFIGIVKETQVKLDETKTVTIKMVDDISPRLTIESPSDGHEQRETDLTVKGTVYDKHTGVDRVMVSFDGEKWHRATMSADKFTYEVELTEVPEGLNLITARAYDNAGNIKERSVSVLVDSTPPSLSIITPEDGMKTNKRKLEIVGTTDVGANVYINDQPVETRYTLISHEMILAEGPNAVKVAAVDYLGNIREEIRYVTLDTQAPYIDIVNVEDGAEVNTRTITIQGQTEDEDVTITVNGEPVKVRGGEFEAEVQLEEGINEIEIHAVDDVENERYVVLTVIRDQTPPWIRLSEPSEDVLTDSTFKVSGYVEQGSLVFVNDREVEVSFGHFETHVSATEGEYTLKVSAEDAAGNERVMNVPLVVDTIAPALEVTYPMEGYITNEATITVEGSITGTGDENLREMELYINGIPRLFDYSSGSFSHQVLMEEGVNRIVVNGVDEAGNDAELIRTVMLDSKAPYLDMFIGNVRMDPNWNEPVSLSDFVYVSGFTEIGAALTINGVSVDVDSETGYFNYSLNLPAPPPDLKISTTDIVATSTDEAGNTVTMTEKVNRLEGVTTEEVEETTTAEWLILFLAVVIFGMALAGAYGYNRIQSQQEMIEAYESAPPPATVTPEGRVVSPPPARPARGGRPRPKPPTPPEETEEEVVIDVEDEEGVDVDVEDEEEV